MSGFKIKVCGMRDAENIMDVAALSPDLMGFIFYEKSPRWVGNKFVVPPDFPARIKRTGVFVNASDEEMLQKAAQYGLGYLQLHGGESVEQCRRLRASGLGVIKVFSIDATFDFDRTIPFEHDADYFLFDTKGKSFGGNGFVFEWEILKKYKGHVPFFLSGGLTPENVTRAMDLNIPQMAGFDFNSGVELAPGVKDISRLKKLLIYK